MGNEQSLQSYQRPNPDQKQYSPIKNATTMLNYTGGKNLDQSYIVPQQFIQSQTVQPIKIFPRQSSQITYGAPAYIPQSQSQFKYNYSYNPSQQVSYNHLQNVPYQFSQTVLQQTPTKLASYLKDQDDQEQEQQQDEEDKNFEKASSIASFSNPVVQTQTQIQSMKPQDEIRVEYFPYEKEVITYEEREEKRMVPVYQEETVKVSIAVPRLQTEYYARVNETQYVPQVSYEQVNQMVPVKRLHTEIVPRHRHVYSQVPVTKTEMVAQQRMVTEYVPIVKTQYEQRDSVITEQVPVQKEITEFVAQAKLVEKIDYSPIRRSFSRPIRPDEQQTIVAQQQQIKTNNSNTNFNINQDDNTTTVTQKKSLNVSPSQFSLQSRNSNLPFPSMFPHRRLASYVPNQYTSDFKPQPSSQQQHLASTSQQHTMIHPQVLQTYQPIVSSTSTYQPLVQRGISRAYKPLGISQQQYIPTSTQQQQSTVPVVQNAQNTEQKKDDKKKPEETKIDLM